MRIFQKYIVNEFIPPFLYCLISFIFMFMIVDLFTHLDEFLRLNVPVKTVLDYYFCFVPIIFVQTAPIAALLSTMFVFGNLSKHTEITAMRASGISTWRIAQPILFLALFISILAYFINEQYVPQAELFTRTMREEKMSDKKKEKSEKMTIIKDVAVLGENNMMLYARQYDIPSKTMQEVIILEHDAFLKLKAKIVLDKMAWQDNKWVGIKYIKYTLDYSGQVIGEPEVKDEEVLDIKETPKDFEIKSQLLAEFMSYKQLKEYKQRLSGTSKNVIRRLAVDMHYKVAFPFVSFVTVLIGIPFALKGRRHGVFMGVGMTVVLVLCYYTLNAVSIALGKGGILPPIISAWLANGLYLILGLLLLNKTSG